MMRIGMTYDSREDYLKAGFTGEEAAEFDLPVTIDGIEAALSSNGYEVDRIGNIASLVERLRSKEKWDLVFNFAEGLRGIAREAQVPALLDAYGIPYTFSDPMVLALTLHKGMTKRVIRDLGLRTPDFAIVEREDDARGIDLPFPLFAKPIAEGTGKGINPKSKAANRKELIDVCAELLRDYKQPVLVETFLPGREFTVGVLGTGRDARTIGTLEVVFTKNAETDSYTFVNKEECDARVTYAMLEEKELGAKVDALVLGAWRGLGCRDAGRIDVRCDSQGEPNFIEVNPLAGLNPAHSDLPMICSMKGMKFEELIGQIVASARKRIGI
jgi:D-alanine-D-alanine ligase